MKSNKVSFYILLALVAVFSTGCTLKNPLTSNTVDNKTSEKSTVNPTPQQNANNNGIAAETPSSLNDLLASNKPQKCTWDQAIDGNNISATIYVNGKSFLQELPMGDKGTFYGYSDGVTFYSWSDATPNGVKMNLTDISKTAEELKQGNTALANTNVDLNKDYNFKCTNWTVDASKFVVPSNVQFVDVADFTKDLKNLMQNVDISKLKDLGGATNP